ncbi:MAG TPA: OsmC family peroxiredoxin [Thermomicrobiales bacterium]|nr:OsmC family peroxiredoxin [Thermomicrobiales bacterium]
MAQIERRANAVWTGDLASGSGTLTGGSGAFGELPVTWAARTEKPGGKTSPEELIAAAHASCYSMALSNTLASAGHPPERLNVTAVCGLDPKPGGGFQIVSSNLSVRGRVPGLDQAGFEEMARQGEQGCPVSNALRNSLQIGLEATLENE